jgi:flagellar hook-associated protein 3 FlgL
VIKNQIDETSSVSGGMLASNIGTGLMQAFKDVQAYQNANGPFTGKLTAAQRTFLEGELAKFDTEQSNLVNASAVNGATAKRIEDAGVALSKRSDALEGMLGDITGVDMADAVSRLQFAQIAVQASAQVFTTLKASSLLNYLPTS